MSEREEYIENIVKGMKEKKRSLIKRYGNKAEDMVYAIARKRADEKFGMNENKLKELVKEALTNVTKKLKEAYGTGRFKDNVKSKDEAKKFLKKKFGADIMVQQKGDKIWMYADKKKVGVWDSKTLKLTFENPINEVVDSKSYIESLNEDIDIEKHNYGVVEKGGSISSQDNKRYFIASKNGYLISTFLTADEAKEYAKRRRKQLSTGEKSYYKMGYTPIQLTPNLKKQLK